MRRRYLVSFALFAAGVLPVGAENPFYHVEDILVGSSLNNSRDEDWKPAGGVALEATGLAALDGDRLAVAIRKGEVWILGGVYGDVSKVTYNRFASGLDEPLGLMRRGKSLLITQRSEITELRDSTGDGIANWYSTLGKGWNVSGAYHGYAYGPVEDKEGALWATLNLDMGDRSDNAKPWRGWGVRARWDGSVEPMCAGMRSPCGLGKNAEGDLFFTDQQGNWIPTNSLHHLRAGAYYGNPDGLSEESLRGSPLKPLAAKVNGLPYPDAMKKLPQLVPPAVWFPYAKIGRSRTGITLDDTGGAFGPYNGQLFIGEFTNSAVDRVFLEKVGGEYQGACFPFMDGFASAVMTTAFGRDGSMFVGMSNRGWSSLGSASYGLQRVRWTGEVPFEVREMRAQPDGFDLIFTSPADLETAGDPASYRMQSYTYPLHSKYGGDEIMTKEVAVTSAVVVDGGLMVRLKCEGLRPLFVHELHYSGVRSADGEPPWHDAAYYTLNRIPGRDKEVRLFNGEDLSGFTTWLRGTKTEDPHGVFSVVDGAIRISGEGFGYLATRERYRNYRLTLDYRWGEQEGVDRGSRAGKALDSGVFLHARGPDGNSHDGGGAYKAAIECNLFEGASGDVLLIRGSGTDGRLILPKVALEAADGTDADGFPYWSEGGKRMHLEKWGRVNWAKKSRAWKDVRGFRGGDDVEKPLGEWNRLVCVCRGSEIEIWLNGTKVNHVRDASPGSGQILLQCEGAEIFFRDLVLERLEL